MSKLANMSEDLRKARVLTEKFPPAESIKLHRGQCSWLRVKVKETLDFAEEKEGSCGHPAQYSKVFRELCRVVLRVKTFRDDCCYKFESDFVLAAIKVSAHRERFIKYYVELDWYIFLIERVRDANNGSVASEKLEGFEWKEKVRLLVEETRSMVEKDFSDFKDLLRKHVLRPGGHQKICATFLRRFKEEAETVDGDDGLGVPPIERKRKLIGRGGFGKVFSFNWKKTRFAIKVPSFNSGTLDKEVAILQKCCHPNIVNLILFHEHPDGKQFLMMEKLTMNLVEYLKSVATGSSVPPLEAVDMVLQVCEGMEYLGDIHRVSHRDLKPENILVKLVSGQDGPLLELQVADFGLAKVRAPIGKSSNQTPNVGTTVYRAPELTRDPGSEGRIYEQSLKADMFSFAVTCSCILTGCEPYKEISADERRQFVEEGGRPSLPVDCPAELTSLLEECWHPEPSKRPASFFEISERLRKLKAMLLTSDVHEGFPSGSSSPENGSMTFQPGVRPLRILVLGSNAEVVEATCRRICGAPEEFKENHNFWNKSVSISPPMCLYRVAADSINYTDIERFVKGRNKPWHQDHLKAAWMEDLSCSGEDAILFANRSQRLHMVWYVCGRRDDLPDAFQWRVITEKLYGVPVQMLVTGTNLYEELPLLKQRFFDNGQHVEDLIIKVDLNDAEAKDGLWRTCGEVKTKAEIRNAATIIGYIREKLGSSGIVIRVGYNTEKTKKFSVKQSKEFILNFLCSYWEIPQSFVQVLPSMRRNPQEETKFVPFCLQDAATILYREREYIHGLIPAEASAESVLQARSNAYFTNLAFDAYENMKSADIQAFLEAVFENRVLPQPLVSGLDRRRSFSKFFGRCRGKGHSP